MAPNGFLSTVKEYSMANTFHLYDLRVTVHEIKGRAVCGMKVGDWFEVRRSSQLVLPEGRHFCLFALAAILPLLPAKQRELSKADWLDSDNLVACPDPEEGLIMRIERLEQLAYEKRDLT